MEKRIVIIRKSEYDRLNELASHLFSRLASVDAELSLLKNGKSNITSSPQSKDQGKNNRMGLRVKSKKKSGNQASHQRHTLLMSDHPIVQFQVEDNHFHKRSKEQ